MSIDDRLRALRADSDALAKRSDALNAEILRIEKALDGVGVGVWLDEREYVIDATEDVGEQISGWLLGYMKLGTRWRIVTREFTGGTMVEDTDDDFLKELRAPMTSAPVALVDAPRLVRVAAAGMLDILVTDITVRVHRLTVIVDRALNRVGSAPESEGAAVPERHEVRVSGFEHDMSGWVMEKAGNVLARLFRVVRDTRSAKGLTPAMRTSIEGEVTTATGDLLKLFSIGAGKQWSLAQRETALRDEEGFNEVVRYYGSNPKRFRLDLDEVHDGAEH